METIKSSKYQAMINNSEKIHTITRLLKNICSKFLREICLDECIEKAYELEDKKLVNLFKEIQDMSISGNYNDIEVEKMLDGVLSEYRLQRNEYLDLIYDKEVLAKTNTNVANLDKTELSNIANNINKLIKKKSMQDILEYTLSIKENNKDYNSDILKDVIDTIYLKINFNIMCDIATEKKIDRIIEVCKRDIKEIDECLEGFELYIRK